MIKGSYIEVQASTWDKDTHGLYDYESKSLQKCNFKITSSCCIYRSKSICYIPDAEVLEDSIPLIKIEQKSTEFHAKMFEETGEKMWLVVKGLKNQSVSGYKLNEGDWIKLGRIRLKVQKISNKPERLSQISMPDFFHSFDADEVDYKNESKADGETTEGAPCRICLTETGTVSDPLISPCKCAGTMKYIHLNCLKEWIKSKVSSRISEKGMSLYIKDLSCELCNTALPSFINYKNQQIGLISINYPTKNYIILEEYRPERLQKQGLHVVSLEEGQSGSLGRGHDCDIKISDISVSRKHCKIKFINSEFYLEDMKSKFGTLAKISSSFVITNNTDITVQVNRTVIHLTYKQPFTFKSLCCCLSSYSKVSVENNSYLFPNDFQYRHTGLSKRATMNANFNNFDSSEG